MVIKLDRKYKKNGYTIGKLSIEGEYFCDTLEDTDRGLAKTMSSEQIAKIKIKNQTAIPTGMYRVNMGVVSPRFSTRSWAKCNKGRVPRLENVPGFDGVLIHPGNSAEDTSGCILVGKNTAKGRVTQSVDTYMELLGRLKSAREIIWIDIR
jgi:hypothetical protein